MKKKVLAVVLVLVLAFSMCMPAFAESRGTSYTPSLQFSGTTANCSVNITELTQYIDASLELWRGETLIDSWTGRGTSVVHISGSCEVDSGTTYALKVTGTVGGRTISIDPVYGTCP